MGVVNNARFINCFWPKLDQPTKIFAEGSSGIEVMGTTPRNVWFPDDVQFLPFYPDALYPAEQAVLRASPLRRGLVNLTQEEAQIWQSAYDEAVKSFPPTHAIYATPRDVNFLRHYEEKSRVVKVLADDSVQVFPDGTEIRIAKGAQITKINYEEFVAPLSPKECGDLVDGKADAATLKTGKSFVSVVDGRPLVEKVK